MKRRILILAAMCFTVASCVSFDLTQPEADYETIETNAEADDLLDPAGIPPFTNPAPNRAPDSSCYLYSGEECVAPVIETSTLAPEPTDEFMIPPPASVPITE